jgi:tripartite-type tricarboxylate transporter receptor subunit TctC
LLQPGIPQVSAIRWSTAVSISRMLLASLAFAATAANADLAAAQAYPSHSVRLVLAFPAGGSIDTLSRIVAQKLAELWGQPVVVENRGGGGGNIGAVAAMQASSDGYTLHMGAQTLAVNVTLTPGVALDPVKDFEPIMLVAKGQDILIVPPGSPFNSVGELINYAKAHPGELTYGSLGSATAANLAAAVLSDLTGIRMRQVSYSSPTQIVTDIMAGRIDAYMAPSGGPQAVAAAQGRLRALAVSGRQRVKQLPDVPTFEEIGIKFGEETSWEALFAPKGTPKEIIAKINGDMAHILAAPDTKERLVTIGLQPIGGTPEVLAALLRHDIAKWAQLAKTPSFAGE